jgi:hypothetical protein
MTLISGPSQAVPVPRRRALHTQDALDTRREYARSEGSGTPGGHPARFFNRSNLSAITQGAGTRAHLGIGNAPPVAATVGDESRLIGRYSSLTLTPSSLMIYIGRFSSDL